MKIRIQGNSSAHCSSTSLKFSFLVSSRRRLVCQKPKHTNYEALGLSSKGYCEMCSEQVVPDLGFPNPPPNICDARHVRSSPPPWRLLTDLLTLLCLWLGSKSLFKYNFHYWVNKREARKYPAPPGYRAIRKRIQEHQWLPSRCISATTGFVHLGRNLLLTHCQSKALLMQASHLRLTVSKCGASLTLVSSCRITDGSGGRSTKETYDSLLITHWVRCRAESLWHRHALISVQKETFGIERENSPLKSMPPWFKEHLFCNLPASPNPLQAGTMHETGFSHQRGRHPGSQTSYCSAQAKGQPLSSTKLLFMYLLWLEAKSQAGPLIPLLLHSE